MLEGALIAVVCFLLGVGVRSLPPRRRGPKPVEAVCGCTHHHAVHDPKTGRCNAAVAVPAYNQFGGRAGNEYQNCACLRCSGPEPMPTYYATEIATEESR